MNPNTMASTLLPSQSINKNQGSGLLVGVTLSQPGGTNGPTPPIIPSPGHTMGPMGDHSTINLQGPPLSGVAASSISLPQSSPQGQSSVTTTGGTAPSSTAPSAGGGIIQSTVTMANMKEKTPMCLINELARFNKVQHQYRLVDESGPPHKKTFTVVLKLDDEEYTASGPSIKKAQHAAAAIALEQTSLKHPPPKNQRKTLSPITPTVELNALAMKRGEPAVYQLVEPQRPQYIPNLNFRGMYHQRYHYPKIPTYYVSLKVGNRQFFGEGRTAQAARHAAADEALTVLRNLPFPDHVKKHPETVKSNGESVESDEDNDLKSPISLVHEIALKRSLPVNFEVIRESGPPHMRTFITRCGVGDLVTEGEGNGKKLSKKRAAERMLDELKKLPPLPPAQQKVKKKPIIKKKNRNLIKEQKADPQYGQGINPISRLIQIQQAKKEREPVYTVIDERGEPRQREFIMQCSLGEVSTTGTGPNKKTAKRNAAESMLQVMGYSRPVTQPGKTSIKGSGLEGPHMFQNQDIDKGRKVMYSEHDVDKLDSDGKLGRQLVPGLLLMPDSSGLSSDQSAIQGYSTTIGSAGLNRAPGGPIQNINKITMQTTSAIAKELLDTGVSPTAESLRKSGHKPMMQQQQPSVRPKQQLLYLADVLGFQVHFTDFPKDFGPCHWQRLDREFGLKQQHTVKPLNTNLKGPKNSALCSNKGTKLEYLSLVSLATIPPQVKHGAGPSVEASHDQAALMALRSLAELGLENVTDGVKKETNNSGLATGEKLYIPGGQTSAPKLANSPTTDLGSNTKGGSTVSITVKDSH